ncbi:RICIN domain-containing protein [Amycolatopsis magusensis]|uniref:RICIN domain-containing protein n=1 Tax=Amycolatopsis magusensis TaxID=882444 RepID=UPI00378E787C
MTRANVKRLVSVLGAAVLGVGGAVAASSAAAEERSADLVGFMLASSMNNRCLNVADANPHKGAMVHMWDCGGWANQRWSWRGENLVSDLNPGQCLDVRGANGDHGAAVGLYDCIEEPQQHWYWEGGQLKNRINGKCLSIPNQNWWNGASVAMWGCGGGGDQYWHTT